MYRASTTYNRQLHNDIVDLTQRFGTAFANAGDLVELLDDVQALLTRALASDANTENLAKVQSIITIVQAYLGVKEQA